MNTNGTPSPREAGSRCPRCGSPSAEEVRKDVDAIFWSLRLHGVRRYFHQRFWESETSEAERADQAESWPKLESVSEHSWHVTDTVLLLSSYFDNLDQRRCLEMAVLHDKLEVITGDADPVGRDGTGADTHAFNPVRRAEKDSDAIHALKMYVSLLAPRVAERQRAVFEEIISGTSAEAHFVKGVDKLQSFAFVIAKKRGHFQDRHLCFTLNYVEKGISGFPGLWGHYVEMRARLLKEVADRRQSSMETIENILGLKEAQDPICELQHRWTRTETSP
jgi:5'-deoxynucleotidase YfbR-like HD superfamily hydrolase